MSGPKPCKAGSACAFLRPGLGMHTHPHYPRHMADYYHPPGTWQPPPSPPGPQPMFGYESPSLPVVTPPDLRLHLPHAPFMPQACQGVGCCVCPLHSLPLGFPRLQRHYNALTPAELADDTAFGRFYSQGFHDMDKNRTGAFLPRDDAIQAWKLIFSGSRNYVHLDLFFLWLAIDAQEIVTKDEWTQFLEIVQRIQLDFSNFPIGMHSMPPADRLIQFVSFAKEQLSLTYGLSGKSVARAPLSPAVARDEFLSRREDRGAAVDCVLECSVCINSFELTDKNKRLPRVLPCSQAHTFCTQCIASLKSLCPVCREPFDEQKAKSAPVNSSFLQLLELFRGPKGVVLGPRTDARCLSHGEKLELFCSSCKEPICQACKGSSHQGHDIILASQAEGALRAKMEDWVAQIVVLKGRASSELQRLGEIQTRERRSEEKARADIQAAHTALVRSLEARREVLLQNVPRTAEAVGVHYHALNTAQSQLDAVAEEARMILSTPGSLFKPSSIIEKHFTSSTNAVNACLSVPVLFSGSSTHLSTHELQTHIADFGRVRSETKDLAVFSPVFAPGEEQQTPKFGRVVCPPPPPEERKDSRIFVGSVFPPQEQTNFVVGSPPIPPKSVEHKHADTSLSVYKEPSLRISSLPPPSKLLKKEVSVPTQPASPSSEEVQELELDLLFPPKFDEPLKKDASGSLVLSWADENRGRDTVWALEQQEGKGDFVQIYSGTNTSFVCQNLKPTKYNFRVRGQDQRGVSPFSEALRYIPQLRFFPDSKVLSLEDEKQLAGFYGGNDVWSLCYRASRDGFGNKDFHSRCDEKGETMVIVRSTSGAVFGGYTRLSWANAEEGKADSHSFLFSLCRVAGGPAVQLAQVDDKQRSISSNPNCMLAFGEGPDLCLVGDCNTRRDSWTNPQSFTCAALPKRGTVEAQSFLAGSQHFQVAEIEVFFK